MILILTGCSKTPEQKIVGQWELDYDMYDDKDIVNANFSEDGVFEMYSDDYGPSKGFYELEGSKLSLEESDSLIPEAIICRFKGDRMIFGDGETELVRVKDSNFTHGSEEIFKKTITETWMSLNYTSLGKREIVNWTFNDDETGTYTMNGNVIASFKYAISGVSFDGAQGSVTCQGDDFNEVKVIKISQYEKEGVPKMVMNGEELWIINSREI